MPARPGKESRFQVRSPTNTRAPLSGSLRTSPMDCSSLTRPATVHHSMRLITAGSHGHRWARSPWLKAAAVSPVLRLPIFSMGGCSGQPHGKGRSTAGRRGRRSRRIHRCHQLNLFRRRRGSHGRDPGKPSHPTPMCRRCITAPMAARRGGRSGRDPARQDVPGERRLIQLRHIQKAPFADSPPCYTHARRHSHESGLSAHFFVEV